MLIVINKITSIASLCLTFIGQKIQTNEAGIDIVDGPKRIFEFIEIAFERIIDEEETMP